ncbi:hypothetical protein SAMN05421767_12220 [Granulicatella balaenopterae]|uniref:Uncharacterized protein n=1 Tax=Granulicatella balaenopterae TaxID=137733 RepID=A0A1H9LX94_9LACT|nr:hypothetical protein [Granulicatella balaenopterae]SER16050.1 hypothetical protein SAMN05421767_12220 [Granulicatella balaenopterae]
MDVKDQQAAQQLLEEIIEPTNNWKIIHYSCKGFDEIRAIAVYSFKTDTTKIIKMIDFANEKEFFDTFFDYIQACGTDNYLHWNLNSTLFGFDAIVDRYQKITNKLDVPVHIVNEERINIAKLLKKYYGRDYLVAEEPKLNANRACYDFGNLKKTDYERLIELNDALMTFKILSDENEAHLLAENTEKANQKVEQSVANKAVLFKEILRLAQANELQTAKAHQEQPKQKGTKIIQTIKEKIKK